MNYLIQSAVLVRGSSNDVQFTCSTKTEPTIPNKLVLSGQIVLTLLSACVIAFGAKNVIKHFKEIKTYLTISIFYFFALTTIVFCLWLSWTNICSWNTKNWQMINALLRNSEICFAWC